MSFQNISILPASSFLFEKVLANHVVIKCYLKWEPDKINITSEA